MAQKETPKICQKTPEVLHLRAILLATLQLQLAPETSGVTQDLGLK